MTLQIFPPRHRTFISCLTACLLTFAIPLRSAPGDVDASFVPSFATLATRVVALPDGKSVWVGTFTVNATTRHLVRVNADGSLDETFPALVLPGNGVQLGRQSDGKWILAHPGLTIDGVDHGDVVRLLPDGAVDMTFDATPQPVWGFGPMIFSELKVDSQDRILLGGTFQSYGTSGAPFLVRLHAEGGVDAGFVPEAEVSPVGFSGPALGVTSGDEVLVNNAGLFANSLEQMDSDGSMDLSFGAAPGSGLNTISGIHTTRDNRLLVTSLAVGGNNLFTNRVIKLLSNGIADPSFRSRTVMHQQTGNSSYYTFLEDALGYYLLGGRFDLYGGSLQRTNLVRVHPDGSPETAFTAQVNGNVLDLALLPDGRVLVAGTFTAINGTSVPGMARLSMDSAASAAEFQLLSTNAVAYENETEIEIQVLRLGPTNAAASVDYNTVSGTAVSPVDFTSTSGTLAFDPGEAVKAVTIPVLDRAGVQNARQFTFTLSNPSAGMMLQNRSASLITLFDDDAEVAFQSGALNISESSGTTPVTIVRNGTNTVTGINVFNVDGTALAGTDYLFVPESLRFLSGETTKEVLVGIVDDASSDDDLTFQLTIDSILGGDLGTPASASVVIQENDSPGYPGQGFSWLTDAANGVRAIQVDEQGRLLAGGGFSRVNGVLSSNLVRLLPNGEIDTTFDTGSGLNGTVYDFARTADGKWLVAGAFSTYNGQPANRLIQLLDDGSPDPDFDIGTGFDSLVESVEILADGRILVAGFFDIAATGLRNGVAILAGDGTLDESFVPGNVSAGYTGHGAIAVGNQIYAYGETTGSTTNSVMRFDMSGNRDLSFMPQVGEPFQNRVTGLAVQPDGKILIAGQWSVVNGVSRNNIARLNEDGTLDATFDPGSGADNWIFRILLESDGRVVLVGNFRNYDGAPRAGIARINPDGSLDTTFDPGAGTETFTDIILGMPDGSYYLGGVFKSFNGVDRFGLTQLNGDGSVALARPEFLNSGFDTGGSFRMELLVEPNLDIRLLESAGLTGWSPVATNSTSRRILEFDSAPAASRMFYQSELLRP